MDRKLIRKRTSYRKMSVNLRFVCLDTTEKKMVRTVSAPHIVCVLLYLCVCLRVCVERTITILSLSSHSVSKIE